MCSVKLSGFFHHIVLIEKYYKSILLHLTPPPGLHKVDSGASATSGQTQISWKNFDQNHIYFVQALHGKCIKMYLTQTKIVHDRHKPAFLVYKDLNDVF